MHAHPAPIRVSYSSVRSAVPAAIQSFKDNHNGRAPDIVLHIGLASSRQYYSVETLARRDGYRITDVDGKASFEEGEFRWKEEGLPEVLRPGPGMKDCDWINASTTTTTTSGGKSDDDVNKSPVSSADGSSITTTTTTTTSSTTNDTPATSTTTISTPSSDNVEYPNCVSPFPPDAKFLETWRSFLPDSKTELKLSNDGGKYLCEFIYFTSLAHAYREGRCGNVMFLHVPKWVDEESIKKGGEVTVALIKTLVNSWVRENNN